MVNFCLLGVCSKLSAAIVADAAASMQMFNQLRQTHIHIDIYMVTFVAHPLHCGCVRGVAYIRHLASQHTTEKTLQYTHWLNLKKNLAYPLTFKKIIYKCINDLNFICMQARNRPNARTHLPQNKKKNNAQHKEKEWVVQQTAQHTPFGTQAQCVRVCVCVCHMKLKTNHPTPRTAKTHFSNVYFFFLSNFNALPMRSIQRTQIHI